MVVTNVLMATLMKLQVLHVIEFYLGLPSIEIYINIIVQITDSKSQNCVVYISFQTVSSCLERLFQ